VTSTSRCVVYISHFLNYFNFLPISSSGQEGREGSFTTCWFKSFSKLFGVNFRFIGSVIGVPKDDEAGGK